MPNQRSLVFCRASNLSSSRSVLLLLFAQGHRGLKIIVRSISVKILIYIDTLIFRLGII
jgi:hypothetical protein